MKGLAFFLTILLCFAGASMLTFETAEAARLGGSKASSYRASSYQAPPVRRHTVVNNTVVKKTTVIHRPAPSSSSGGSGGFLGSVVGGAVGAAGGMMLMDALSPDPEPAPQVESSTVTPQIQCPPGYVCSPSIPQ